MDNTIKFISLDSSYSALYLDFKKTLTFQQGEWYKPLRNNGLLDRIHYKSTYSTFCIIETVYL